MSQETTPTEDELLIEENLPFSNNAALLVSLFFGPIASMIIINSGLQNIWDPATARKSLITGITLIIFAELAVIFTDFSWKGLNVIFWLFLYFTFYRWRIINWWKSNPDKKFAKASYAFMNWILWLVLLIGLNYVVAIILKSIAS